MKYLLAIFLALPCYAVDVVLGNLSDLTWTGTGADRVASFASAPSYVEGSVYISQNFSTWGTTSSGTSTTNEGWILSRVYVVSTPVHADTRAIRYTTGAGDAYALTPILTNGIGTVNFYWRANGSSTAYLQTSPDLINWNAVYTLAITGVSVYVPQSVQVKTPATNLYLRILTQALGVAFLADTISVTSYGAAP